MVLALVRGDHRLNEIKLANALGAEFRQATAEEIEAELGPPGFIGPVGAQVPVVKDAAIQGAGYFAGANRPDAHLIGVEPGRDFDFEELDFRTVEAGDLSPAGDPIEIEDAIEVGNIFKLGTRYSEPLGATYLDPDGKERPIVMGSYGIGPGADRRRRDRAERRREGDRLAAGARAVARAPGRARQGRRGGRGGRRAPLRGARARPGSRRCSTIARPAPGRSSPTPSCSAARCGSWSASGRSPRARWRRRSGAPAPSTGSTVADAARRAARDPRRARLRMAAPRSKRRLFGIDRSGPAAERDPARARRCTRGRSRTSSATCAWPRSRSSACSRSPATTAATRPPALLYLAITAGDYLDGFLARATGQYSRMGALLDPVVDRLTVLAGAAVCWHFELLPRWALAVLAVREVVTLVLAQLALRRGHRPRDQLDRADRRLPGLRRDLLGMVVDWWIIRAGVRRRASRSPCSRRSFYVRAALGVAAHGGVQPSSST